MKKIFILLTTLSSMTFVNISVITNAQNRILKLTGTVDRVWDDGFILKTKHKNITVDSWDLCGDNTFRYLSEGDLLVVRGEYEGGEFDTFSLENSNKQKICPGRYRD